MTEQAPLPKPTGFLYEDFGTGRHRESSLVRHALGSVHEEEPIAGLAGGIGFMYFVFEYAGHPPLLTIVAQAHPDPWVEAAALDRLGDEVTHSSRPRWDRVRAALDAGGPVFCAVDRSRLPWHGGIPHRKRGPGGCTCAWRSNGPLLVPRARSTRTSSASRDDRGPPPCSATRPRPGPGSRNWRARPTRTRTPPGGAPSSTSSPPVDGSLALERRAVTLL